jgi:hypothetical protein
VIEARQERPLLATLICIWEVFIVALAIGTRYMQHHLQHSLRPVQPLPQIHLANPLQPVASWLTYTLAVLAAVTLWRMHRSAFVFLAGRFCLSLALFIVGILRMQSLLATMPSHQSSINFSTIAWMVSAVAIIGIALDAFIAWYAYYTTSPKALSPPNPEAPAYT